MSKNLSLTLLVLFCFHYRIKASSDEVKTKFRDEQIEPDVIDDLLDIGLLKIKYSSGIDVELGETLTPTQVKDQPDVTWEAEDGAFYTLLMTNPDASSRNHPSFGEVRHWLVVNIPGNDLKAGETVVQFVGSGPPKGTDLHRYVFLLFKQETGKISYDLPLISDHSFKGRLRTSTKELIIKFSLKLIAGNFYQAKYDDYVPKLHKQMGLLLTEEPLSTMTL